MKSILKPINKALFTFRSVCRLFILIIFMNGWLTGNEVAARASIHQQSIQDVSGVVTDKSNTPLPGVTVAVKGTTNGTITNGEGVYHLKVSKGDVLVFRFMGMTTQEIPYNGQASINSVMSDDQLMLDEVVAIGYGSTKKRDLTGAVVSLDKEIIESKPLASVDQALQGQVSGVTVKQNSGQPGGGISVRVRGITSLTGGNEPLYVIDGVPVDANENNETVGFSSLGGGNGQTRVSALSTINPSDIESIEVLKDASATAIYGSRAANGVILIKTKSGAKGKSVITYDGYFGVQQPIKQIDMMNLQEYAKYQNEIRTDLGWGIPLEYARPERLGEGTNWQDEIFRDAYMQNHQIGISGGSDKTSFYTSFNYFDQDGIVLNTDFKRYSMRINVDHQVKSWMKIGNTISISNTDEHITLTDASDGVISGSVRQAPDIPVRYSDGNWGGPTETQGVGGGNNPVAWSEIRNSALNRRKVMGNFYADASFLKDFRLRTEFGYDYNVNNSKTFNPTYSIGVNENTVSESFRRSTNSLYWIAKAYLNYNKSIKKHTFSVMAGVEAQENEYQFISGTRKGFLTNDVTELSAGDLEDATNDSGINYWNMLSYYGRGNYQYNNKYLFTGTLRADGSSNFAEGNRWGVFPSFSMGWVASEEQFFKDLVGPTVSWLKVRFGYGEVGNQKIPSYTYGSLMRNVATPSGTSFVLENISNPDVTWETMVSSNIGVEVGFLNSRIRVDVDLYDKTSTDFLYQLPLPDMYGAVSGQSWLGLQPPYTNQGEMQNRGVDITLNTLNIKKPLFEWKSTVVFSKYNNKLISLAEEGDMMQEIFEWNYEVSRTEVGQAIGQFYGYQVDKLFESEEEIRNSASQGDKIGVDGIWIGDIKWKDLNGDMVIDEKDKDFIGNPHPDFTFSFTNDFKYKNLDLSIFIDGSYGNEIYNWSRRYTEGMMDVFANAASIISDRYTEANTDTEIPRFAYGDPNDNARVSDRFIEDGSFIRIKTITLGYTLPKRIVDGSDVFSSARFYGTVQNLHTFSDYSGYDPDIGSYDQNARLSGFDAGRYPLPRTIMFGLSVKF